MNNRFKNYALIWVILLIVFNVLCFVTPASVTVGDQVYTKFDGSFWAAYIFITLAFLGQLACAKLALKAENSEKLFYNVPLIRISYTGLILTLIFGGLCMAIPKLPGWVGVIVCVLVLAFTAIAVVKAKAAAEEVEAVEQKVKAKTLFIKSLTVDADSLISRASSEEAGAACRKVYEAVRYSDPMSSDALVGVESQITLKFNEFSNAVASGAEDVSKLADELVVLIEDRNKKCRMLK